MIITHLHSLQAAQMATHDTTVLCTHKQPSQDINLSVLRTLFQGNTVRVPLGTNAGNEISRDTTSWLKEDGFHTLSEAAIGARVMLTRNINLHIGAVNGAVGTITAFHYGKPRRAYKYTGQSETTLNSISVQLHHSNQVQSPPAPCHKSSC
jgi:hypothetical protein